VTDLLSLAAGNLLSPMTLFFALGFLAGRWKSDLAVPEAVSKGLSLYLMLSIGFRGGVEVSHGGPLGPLLGALFGAVALSFLMPLVAFFLLRRFTALGRIDASSVAAHYGSVSVVTFVTAVAFLERRGETFEPYLVAMLALMETPAIVTGLLLARGGGGREGGGVFSREVMREVLLSGSIVLLAGSFLIGAVTGERGMELLGPAIGAPFHGVLSIFLLDMGLLTARRVPSFRKLGFPVLAFGLYMPLAGASFGLLLAAALGLSTGGAALVAVLGASASYIVVPAAMRLALPEANPALAVALALGVTFPFNLTVGIPLYLAVAGAILPG
jgi:hypothetical protein